MKGTPQITQRNPGRNHIESVRTALQKLSQHYYPNGVESQPLQTRPIPMHKQDCSGESSMQIHLLPQK